jgi:hypothetical protein
MHALIVALGSAAAVIGTAASLYYARADLTLSHYDARGHLVVARRIIDSITPGWQQIGAVWLPLPHVLNALPVQVDMLYRTGASGVALSIVAFAIATAAIGWIVLAVTGSRVSALVGAAAFAMNPNVLFLQATPMTEPMLLGLLALAVALLMAWTGEPTATGGSWHSATRRRPQAAAFPVCTPTNAAVGWAFALACMTRYEAWPATACALALAGWARMRRGDAARMAAGSVARIAVYPAAAIVGFVIFSRIVIGEWFVSSGFFVPDNPVQGRPLAAAVAIWWGTHQLSGYGLSTLAAIGLGALAVRGVRARERAWATIPVALVATAALPWLAFLNGHPFRIRYMVPLLAAEAIGVGVAAASIGRLRRLAPLAVAAVIVLELRPVAATAPMIVEAQWDRPNALGRAAVTVCLTEGYRGETVMASMGSLGHYMQSLSRVGFRLRDFLHEGNGDIWLAALDAPKPYVGWVLIEELAEGGDMLAQAARENPRFLDGFSRVCEGAGVALYQRQNRMLNVAR